MVEVNWIKQKIKWLNTPYITHTQPQCIVSTNISPHNYSGASDLDYWPAFQGQPYIWNLMVMQSGLNLDSLIYVPDPGWYLRKIPHNLQQTNGHLFQISDFRKEWLKVPQTKAKKKRESKILVKNASRGCQSIHATDKRQNLYFGWDWLPDQAFDYLPRQPWHRNKSKCYYSPCTDAGTARAAAAWILILKLEESRNSRRRILNTDGALSVKHT